METKVMASIWRGKGDKSYDINLERKGRQKLWHQFGDKRETKVMTSIWRQKLWHQLGEKREIKVTTSIWRKRESNVMTSKWELLCPPVYLLSHSFPFTLFLPQVVSLLLKVTKSSRSWSSHGINSPWHNGEKRPPSPIKPHQRVQFLPAKPGAQWQRAEVGPSMQVPPCRQGLGRQLNPYVQRIPSRLPGQRQVKVLGASVSTRHWPEVRNQNQQLVSGHFS